MPTDSDFQTVTAESLQRIDDIFTIALDFKTKALTDIDTLVVAAQAHIALLDGETFDPTISGSLDLAYATPTEATEPDYSTEGPNDPSLEALSGVAPFSYTDSTYVALIKTEMQAKLVSVLSDNLIVPTAIWDAIYERARGKLSAQQVTDEWNASDLDAARGWSQPSEGGNADLDRIQDQVSQQTIALIVEQAIAEAKERHDDLWKAMQNGTQFEGMWIGEQHQRQLRLLDAAKAAVSQNVAINAQLIQHNDLLIRQYAIKWDSQMKHVAAATARYSARVQARLGSVQSESARLGYQKTMIDQGIKIEEGVTNLAIKRTELAQVLVESLTQVANLMAAMAQGALSASDVSVGTGTGYSYSENLTL